MATNSISIEEAKTVCKVGQGEECCRYITLDKDGLVCEKHTEAGRLIDKNPDEQVGKGNNCNGKPLLKKSKASTKYTITVEKDDKTVQEIECKEHIIVTLDREKKACNAFLSTTSLESTFKLFTAVLSTVVQTSSNNGVCPDKIVELIISCTEDVLNKYRFDMDKVCASCDQHDEQNETSCGPGRPLN